MTDGPLPETHAALLDEDQEAALFTDISTMTEFVEARIKGAPRTQTSDAPLTLEQAIEQWRNGSVRGVQLRYRYQGTEWWDTLLRTPEGTRLVRIGHRWETIAAQ